jgi:hypothetical protein
MQYDWTKTLYKVLLILAPMLGTLGISFSLPESLEKFQQEILLVVLSLCFALYKGGKNIYDHWNDGVPKASTPPSVGRCLIPVLVCLSMMMTGASGCALNKVKFVDGTDGSCVVATDCVPIFMKRDLSSQSATYTWTGKGGGKWNIGSGVQGTDGTDAIQAITSIVDFARMIQTAFASPSGAGVPVEGQGPPTALP